MNTSSDYQQKTFNQKILSHMDEAPNVRSVIFLPEVRACGAVKPSVRQVPKSSPMPLTRVFGAVVLIYNVHLMNGEVFGCLIFLRVVFAHVR